MKQAILKKLVAFDKKMSQAEKQSILQYQELEYLKEKFSEVEQESII